MPHNEPRQEVAEQVMLRQGREQELEEVVVQLAEPVAAEEEGEVVQLGQSGSITLTLIQCFSPIMT